MKIAVLDIETCGMNPNIDPFVEIGICLLDMEKGTYEKLLDTPVHEKHFSIEKHGKSWIFIVSTLTSEQVMSAPTWEDIAPRVKEIAEQYTMTSYNKGFDLGFLSARGIVPKRTAPDPMLLCTDILKIPHSFYGIKYPALEESWKHFFGDEAPYKEQHRAYDDAFHEAMLIQMMNARGLYSMLGKTRSTIYGY
jgi:DNA polymerase III epsilon subunit-like protein